ncbi:hypothetical protein CONPUDRAFT_150894 [Coniophora puteana RWD-64-598 SS2]|uniref:Uncharacterized protein n=1 Tax=Coniophora puteana (strain RWD-64-598) TaxID=741705 RepID=A0A5M3MZ12_CONPW|nr:uncharacterized protein CONPUDRAFT_150894 [Coniophora puteana RWD-64-598 SS2]EIW83841.1 hypothetical protein CONPUDRAFT_150894 [Coniophora puteana RWD-64-598 SS2]
MQTSFWGFAFCQPPASFATQQRDIATHTRPKSRVPPCACRVWFSDNAPRILTTSPKLTTSFDFVQTRWLINGTAQGPDRRELFFQALTDHHARGASHEPITRTVLEAMTHPLETRSARRTLDAVMTPPAGDLVGPCRTTNFVPAGTTACPMWIITERQPS